LAVKVLQPIPASKQYDEPVRRFLDLLRKNLNQVLSSTVTSYETITGDADVGNVELVVCNSATAITITMFAGTEGRMIKVSNIGAGTVTIECDGTETIGGNTTFDLFEREDIELIFIGTDWI